jgi:hypothetical protein
MRKYWRSLFGNTHGVETSFVGQSRPVRCEQKSSNLGSGEGMRLEGLVQTIAARLECWTAHIRS